MPCTLTGSFEGDRELLASLELTQLTQLLCGACKLLESSNISMDTVFSDVGERNRDVVPPVTLTEWWTHHKTIDEHIRKKGS